MLNFLSKLFGKKQPARQDVQPGRKKKLPVQNDEKIEAVQLAEQLADDEALIIDFLKKSRFADARYAAALKLRTEDTMREVKALTQKSDRRVYRLMQTRLNELEQSQQLIGRIEEILSDSQLLLKDPTLTPSQVVAFEHRWAALENETKGNIPADRKAAFETCRAAMEARLQDQLNLQREIKSASDELLQFLKSSPDFDDCRRVLDEFAGKLVEWRTSLEVSSLPKNTIEDFAGLLSSAEERLIVEKREQEAIQARVDWLGKKEILLVDEIDRKVLEQEWIQLPQVSAEGYAPLQTRYQALRAKILAFENLKKEQEKAQQIEKESVQPTEEVMALRKEFESRLMALRQAIDAGALQEAQQYAEALRQPEFAVDIIGQDLLNQFNKIQNELRHLSGWAKWSDRLSRDNLIAAANDLAQKKLGIDDLANAVMQLREEWKKLNTVSGMATREQWATFDAACNKAYEPVLVHARAKADEKKKNVRYAESIIEDIKGYSERFKSEFEQVLENGASFDWKPLINFYRQTLQDWRRLGIVGRNEKKRLDEEMAAALTYIREKLYEQTRIEIQQREQLIEEVTAIDSSDADAGRLLKLIQQKWQSCARNFPLDNREDRKLWNRFKAACEAIHEGRMGKVHSEEHERLDNLRQKEDICTGLEGLDIENDLEAFDKQFHQLLDRWEEIGPVPHDADEAIQKRFDEAVIHCGNLARQLKNKKLVGAMDGVMQKLRLCSDLENWILGFLSDAGQDNEEFSDESFEQQWKALPALPDNLEAILSTRFYNGLKAAAVRNIAYARRLQNNLSEMQENLHGLEIAYGIETSENADDAVRKKQDGIQSQEKPSSTEAIKLLLELPAPAQEDEIDRIAAVLMKVAV